MNRFFETNGQPHVVEQIRSDLLYLNKANLAATLVKTDWQVIRAADPTSGKPLPDNVLQEREQYRQRCDQVEMEILAAVSYEELLAIYQQYL
jgi:hypothetical protein